jgi:hypothetical protein
MDSCLNLWRIAAAFSLTGHDQKSVFILIWGYGVSNALVIQSSDAMTRQLSLILNAAGEIAP